MTPELHRELEALVAREVAKVEALLPVSPIPEVTAELSRAKQRLVELVDWARGAADVEVPDRAAWVFKASVNARTLLLRHTPALEGIPQALDPAQRAGGSHLVDYARGGYFLELDDRFPEGVRFDDHPRLAELGRSIRDTLGRSSAWEPLLFTSGMGAIDTALDWMAERARGQPVLLGAHAWIEVKEYVDHTWPGAFSPIDEAEPAALAHALGDPAVAGLVIEPLVNHPASPVVALREVLRAPIRGDKVLLLDLALTPELDVDAWLPDPLPPNLTVLVVTSGVKFFQAGWDLSKSGLLEVRAGARTAKPEHEASRELILLRGRSGRVLSAEEAELADLETPTTLRSRLARLDANTRALAVTLDRRLQQRGVGRVSSPWLEHHPHVARARELGTGGRFVYVDFDPSVMPPTRLGSFDRELARTAKARGIPLIVATTFGLAVPHVCLLAHPVEGLKLRVSPGSSGGAFVEAIAELIVSLV